MKRKHLRTLGWLAAVSVIALSLTFLGSAAAQQSREDLESTLPPSNFGGTETAHSASTIAPGFARASVPINPLAPEAKAVGEQMCMFCHQLEDEHFSHTLHALGLRAAAQGRPGAPVCETCHGPGSVHIENPLEQDSIIRFTHQSGSSNEVQTGACLSCHEGGPRDHWTGSVHQRNDLTCSDCHNSMSRFSPESTMFRSSINETCSTCHQDVRNQFERRSHMPLPEGQMSCADCHNPHGSLTQPLLKTTTVNETCYQCHAEKRGPFLFEHAPVRGSCLNCHSPHGSNQVSLLVAPMPFLCQQCHSHVRHPNDLLTAQSLATGTQFDERLLGRSCVTCHSQIHGSNNPSGPRLHR